VRIRDRSRYQLVLDESRGHVSGPAIGSVAGLEALDRVIEQNARTAVDGWGEDCRIKVTPCNFGAVITYEREVLDESQHAYDKACLYLRSTPVAGEGPVSGQPATSGIPANDAGDGEAIFNALSRILLSAIGRPEEGSEQFILHVALALRVHAERYRLGVQPLSRTSRGGLAPWQERRAKALMEAELDGPVPMGQIAGACGISVAHFARAFKLTTGLPPHRWLLERRVERSKSLLMTTALSLVDIANTCGFAEQSHFTRVFTKRVGISPGAWRRAVGRAPLDSILLSSASPAA
jgi:AraC-like DNA-binding protein